METLKSMYTHSSFFCTESAPMRPSPMNVPAGLWYTLAKLDISLMSSSKSAGEIFVLGMDIGGR